MLSVKPFAQMSEHDASPQLGDNRQIFPFVETCGHFFALLISRLASRRIRFPITS